MTIAANGKLCLILICLMLAGCSTLDLGELKLLQPTETQVFSQALDQYIDTGDLTGLKQIPEQYPQGEWRFRAEAIVDLAEQQQALQARQKDAGGKLAQCEQEKKRLEEDNRILNTTLERLKQVLIDTELRGE